MSNPGPTGVAPVLQVHPTRRCNLACAHCYSSSGPRERQALAPGVLATCLDDAVALGYRQLAVSGGEPLLYAPLGELLAHARALGMVTSVTTNGTLATPRRWEALAGLIDVAAVSIDGTPSEHDAIRGRAGAFAGTVRNLEVIRGSGVPFGFIFTLTQYNVVSLEFVVRLAAEHGARSVQVHPLTLHGRAATELPGARPDGLELTFALFEAVRLGRELGVVVHVDALTLDQLLAHRSALVPERPVSDLVAVAPILVVDPDGRILPLTHEISPRLALGSLGTDRLFHLAGGWLAAGRGDMLAASCATTWAELTGAPDAPAVYWYDEVAARTWDAVVPLRPALRATS
ncbi:MAG TPA: radical SAM protein [Kofleriaceae bacterium]|nr:radical SAM protein [Kofleriaceae bacterium]